MKGRLAQFDVECILLLVQYVLSVQEVRL
jgi:hypothetical protein